MARFPESILRAATGRFLWANLAALVFIKFLLPLGSGGLAAITEPMAGFAPTDIIRLTNEARRASQLSDLRHNAVLDAAAARKLDDMAAQQYFAHVTPDGRQPWDFIRAAGYGYSVAGENLAKGFTDPSTLVSAWMGSPSHRANLVNTSYRDIGVAVRRVTLNGVSTLLVVQMFGTPLPSAATPPPATPVPAASKPATPMPTTAVARPSAAPQPQRVSTQRAVAPVASPVTVAVPTGAGAARIADALSGGLMAELALLLALLSVAALWTRFHPRVMGSWSATAAMLALVAVIPTAARTVTGSIF